MSKFKFKLGSIVKDKISGFEGIITVRSQHQSGCNTYDVNPQKINDKGTPIDSIQFPELDLQLVPKQSTKN